MIVIAVLGFVLSRSLFCSFLFLGTIYFHENCCSDLVVQCLFPFLLFCDLMLFCVIVMLVFCSNYFLVEEEFAVWFIRLENVSLS